MSFNFANPRIPLGSWIETFFDWFQHAFDWLITFTNVVIGGMYDGLNLVLSKPLYLVMMVILAAIGWACANWKVGLFALIGFYLVRAMDQWNNTMHTLSLVVVAVILALILAIPLGIWAAKSKRFSAIIKPILDFMQTMPSLAYLVPVIVLFGIGQVPGAIATIIFARAHTKHKLSSCAIQCAISITRLLKWSFESSVCHEHEALIKLTFDATAFLVTIFTSTDDNANGHIYALSLIHI